MANRDIVVIGASAGGLDALKTLASSLPGDLKASIFVVLHIPPHGPDVLPGILKARSALPVTTPSNGEIFEPGHIYVAPPDRHLLVESSATIRVTRGPRENRFRPSIDALFRSAAYAFGPRVIGVILTGYLGDGTSGLWAVRERGGTAIVQNPEEAVAPSMPLTALKNVDINYCVPLKKIAPLIVDLTHRAAEVKGVQPMSKEMEAEVRIAREENALKSGILDWGEPSLLTCPECHGALLQMKEGGSLRFRCHTGHGYSIESLLSEFKEQTEKTLWNALRSLDESVMLLKRMAAHLSEHHHSEAADELLLEARTAQQRSERVRELLMDDGKNPSGQR